MENMMTHQLLKEKPSDVARKLGVQDLYVSRPQNSDGLSDFVQHRPDYPGVSFAYISDRTSYSGSMNFIFSLNIPYFKLGLFPSKQIKNMLKGSGTKKILIEKTDKQYSTRDEYAVKLESGDTFYLYPGCYPLHSCRACGVRPDLREFARGEEYLKREYEHGHMLGVMNYPLSLESDVLLAMDAVWAKL